MDWTMDDVTAAEPPAAAAAGQRDPAPEGTHLVRIARASEDGPKLKLALAVQKDGEDDKALGWIWFNPPRDRDWGKRLVGSLMAALGMSLAEWNATWASDLEDRLVEADVYHRLGADGRTFVNVRTFRAAVPKEEAKSSKAKPKTQAQKVVADLPEDDIPF